VWDALHHKTSYHFNHRERVTSIDYLYHKQPIRQDAFHWSNIEGQEGWLRAKAIQIGDQVSYLKTFRYDLRGNIIRETSYGNITGQKPATFAITQN
jgi:hypothetical protein